MRKIEIQTPSREALVNLTAEVSAVVKRAGLTDGIVHLYSPHTTAGLVIQEGADPMVAEDLLRRLRELIPHHHPADRHLEGNSDAHLKTALVGQSVTVPVQGGRLLLGTWQQIFLAEFDGPRRRRVWVSFLAAAVV